MALDFNSVGQQIRQMSSTLRSSVDDRQSRVDRALSVLAAESSNWQHWADQTLQAYKKSPWLLAAPAEPLNSVYDRPRCPATYTLVAVDGSQIDLDRHGSAECFLINLGLVFLRYGSEPTCQLRTQPQLFYRDDEITLRDANGRQYTMAGGLVHAERDTREGIALAQLATSVADGSPCVAMQDGTLIRWSLSALEPWLQDHFLSRYLQQGLQELQSSGVALCSYISRPRAPEITGLLRLIADPELTESQRATPLADPYHGVNDFQIFARLLADGQRSALFRSLSKINVERYAEHTIYFFYLNVNREIVRIELPEWAATNAQHLELIHAVAYDQAQRGAGYPVALARAHEQAVVREADRRVFRQMLQEALWHSRLSDGGSLKADSKEWQRV